MTPREHELFEDRRHEERRTLSRRMRVEWSLVVQVITWVVAALLTYGAINARVAVVESRQIDLEHRLDRIESKLDRVLEHVR